MKQTDRYQYSELTSTPALCYGRRPRVKIPESDGDIYHTVTDADCMRLDTLAWKYYKDVSLWWVIAEANDLSNPFDLRSGTTLRIPSLSTIQLKVIG